MWSIRGDPLGKPKCLNTFVIPDTSIKTSTMITDVAEPLMLAVIYRNIMAAIAAREWAGIPQHHAPRVCGWGCKGYVTLIKHGDKVIWGFSGVSFSLWSEERLLYEYINGVKCKVCRETQFSMGTFGKIQAKPGPGRTSHLLHRGINIWGTIQRKIEVDASQSAILSRRLVTKEASRAEHTSKLRYRINFNSWDYIEPKRKCVTLQLPALHHTGACMYVCLSLNTAPPHQLLPT